MERVYLMRHGHRQDDLDRTWAKRAKDKYNPPLSLIGIKQSFAAGVYIQQCEITPQVIFSSFFIRAIQTATPLAQSLDLKINLEHSLSEILRNKWFPDSKIDWASPKELCNYFPNINTQYESLLQDLQPPEGRRETRERVANFMHWLMRQKYKSVALIGHGFSIKDCLGHFGYNHGIPPKGEVFVAARRGKKWDVRLSK